MRYIASIIISVLAVSLCALLFSQLFNQPYTMAAKTQEHQPDIVFVDMLDVQNNQACKLV